MPSDDTSRFERFAIRLSDLSDIQIALIRKALPELEWSVTGAESTPVLAAPLSPYSDYDGLTALLAKQRTDQSNVVVVITVMTSSDHSGVSVPENVMRIIRNARCAITFLLVADLEPPPGEEKSDEHCARELNQTGQDLL